MTFDRWAQLLVPIIAVVVAIIPAALSYHFTKKQQIRADERRLKEKYYLNFIDALNYNVMSNDLEDAKRRLSEARNQLLLVASCEVICDLRRFSDYIGPANADNFLQSEHDRLLTSLIKSMRKDLYKDKKINKDYPNIDLSGKRRREDKQHL
ncbi:MAG: hypothetical protein Q8S22_07540 [Eubacteriales bacterium]|jgi:hypothetical protein|nr:hypothetical protein [Eubacteriales bacterium]